ncbi:hypothetical protein PIB30_024216 [Stylosanthes scabra]|uniref:Benzyl alcohol O-benzoyltransferase n=1 Tax=Stylosanthes scabra TaxID=79078 RepID=A0ABU6R9Y5_9FABA|nr:hypothetical protein [Stylosanthes scabra]
MARGAHQPSVLPIWQRDLLSARNPPRITYNHPEFDKDKDIVEWQTIIGSIENMIERFFFFGPTEIASLRCLILNNNHQLGEEYTRFELITACLWYCLAKALQLPPEKEVRMCCVVNGRERFNPPMPIGYYGNVISFPAAVTIVKKFCEDPFECVVTRIGFRKVDFGWGNAVYGGVTGANNSFGEMILMDYENSNGEEGVLIPIYLPADAMKRFAKELDDMLRNPNQTLKSGNKYQLKSTL